jgi:hypothetical protein
MSSAPAGFEREARFLFKTDIPEPINHYTGPKVSHRLRDKAVIILNKYLALLMWGNGCFGSNIFDRPFEYCGWVIRLWLG